MKNSKKIYPFIYAALTTACLMPAAALAAADAFGHESNNDYFPTWYLGLHGGGTGLQASDSGSTVAIPDTDFDLGFAGGVSAGIAMPKNFIQPFDGLRFEAEISHYWQQLDGGGSLIENRDGRDYDITSYMANAYYYFPLNNAFSPYIGGGIGKATVELGDAPGATTTADNEADVDAWQAMAGFAFEESPDALTEWSIGYRYFTTDEPSFGNGFGGTTKVENTVHSLELGMHLRF